MGRRRYRQLFLFLAVLALPGVMIGVQGWRLSVQERELARSRVEEIRARTAAEIGQDMVARLERIRTRAMANAPATSIRRNSPADPAVVVVGVVEEDRLLWPWDVSDLVRGQPERHPDFARAIDEGRRAEFVDRHYHRAAHLYQQVAETARHDAQRASARLGLARVHLRDGRRPAALAVYRELLELPSAIADANGLSYWSSAATPLVELGASRDVLERINGDLDSPVPWPPIQLYRLRSILIALRDSRDGAVAHGAAASLQRLGTRLADVERAENLRTELPKLPESPTDWHPYKGGDLWLVGRSPAGAAARPLVLVVRGEIIRQAVEADRLARQAGSRFEIAAGGAGLTLSEYLPGLRVTFPDGVADQAPGLNPQRSLWGLSFALVALLTILGGYLLWRDMRRDAHIAELRTQFVSSVSHELKTPLTSIRMFAELLQMRESNDSQQVRFLDTIVSESERLTRLLNNVLDFSRIERGQKAYRLEPVPLVEVVQAAVRTIQYPLAQQGFVLDLSVTEGIPPVAADRDALHQAILNLLTNAMKYSGDRREIGLRLCRENGDAAIQVSDRGIGIHEREHSRIFEKFYRVPIPENQDISGTGLGLALVAHVAEAHGGSVHVQSRPGEGSTFSVLLPLNAGGTE